MPSLIAPILQQSLFASSDEPSDLDFDALRTCDLGRGAWVDFVPNWVPNADRLFEVIYDSAPWDSEEQRTMYDRRVDVPRLTTGVWVDGRPGELDDMSAALSERYEVDLVSISANLYRDGKDSVAWHGDRVGITRANTVVAIVSLGSTRQLLIRPDGGGRSIGFPMQSGDLVVMGGTAQRTHEHCVPKRSIAGPRISVMFRERWGH